MKNHFRSLYRSPLKTLVTLLLLAAAAFLFLYNLSEYSISDREYREARDRYEGVLTVEVGSVPENTTVYDLFLLTDETGRTPAYDTPIFNFLTLNYESHHQQSLTEDLLETLGSLPHISRVDRRYLTAGVYRDAYRMDNDKHFFPYCYRAVVAATVKYRFTTDLVRIYEKTEPWIETAEYLTLEDTEVLAGDPAWIWDIAKKQDYEENFILFSSRNRDWPKEEYR